MYMFGARPIRPQAAVYTYRVQKSTVENEGKIKLPAAVLNDLADAMVQYPLLFKIQTSSKKFTHCGVLEFTAKNGFVIMPEWIMKNLNVREGEHVTVTNVNLSLATFIKLQPQSVDFLDIFDPKAVLEKTLRSYSAVTKGENILIRYNNKDYFLKVMEIQPLNQSQAVSIVEADVNVEFAPPVGYVEPTPVKTETKKMIPTTYEADPSELDPSQVVDSDDEEEVPQKKEFTPFTGQGAKISGKPITAPTSITQKPNNPAEEKKPYLINGAIHYLTQAEYEARQKPSQQPTNTSNAQPARTLGGGQTPRGTTNTNTTKPADPKAPFTGKGYSLK